MKTSFNHSSSSFETNLISFISEELSSPFKDIKSLNQKITMPPKNITSFLAQIRNEVNEHGFWYINLYNDYPYNFSYNDKKLLINNLTFIKHAKENLFDFFAKNQNFPKKIIINTNVISFARELQNKSNVILCNPMNYILSLKNVNLLPDVLDYNNLQSIGIEKSLINKFELQNFYLGLYSNKNHNLTKNYKNLEDLDVLKNKFEEVTGTTFFNFFKFKLA